MATLVIIPGTIRSKLITAMELRTRLERAGHRVIVIAPSKSAADELGHDCLQADLSIAVPESTRTLTNHALLESCRAAADAVDIRHFQQCLEQLAPDLILVDIESHQHTIVAVQAGYRVALINVFFNLWKQPSVPPIHVPITPGVGIEGTRLGIELSWLRYRIWRWWQLMKSRRNGVDHLALLEAFARRTRFSLKHQVDYFQGLLPFVYRHLPIINTNLLELELPHKPGPGCHYVGPMASPNRYGLKFTEHERPAVEEISRLVQRVREAGTKHKLIYCAFGSYYFGDNREFWCRIIRAVQTRPEWTVILGLGERLKLEDLGKLPSNVHGFPWAPQMHALAHADCAVIHGGMTSVYECIYQRVPMLVYPHGEIFDQFGTAARVQYRGLGIVGDRMRDEPAVIAEQIDRVLTDSEIRERVGTMRDHMIRCYDEGKAAQAVSTILAHTLCQNRTSAPPLELVR